MRIQPAACLASLRFPGLAILFGAGSGVAPLLAQDVPYSGGVRTPVHQHAATTGLLQSLDVSLGLLAAVGASTASDDELAQLAGGAHDPRQRGFTFQQAELAIAGDVTEWLAGKAYLVAAIEAGDGETIVELEEAFLTTRQLPSGLEARAGTFFTEFGRLNPTHPHARDWQNQPVIMTRLFGGDGMRGPGARLAWRHGASAAAFTVQNAHGETMPSFLANAEVYEDQPIGGRSFTEREVHSLADLLYTVRGELALLAAPERILAVGASASFGPNATGPDTDTLLWGVDLLWQADRPTDPDCCAFASWSVQAEWFRREFEAAAQIDSSDPLAPVPLPATTLRDQGAYAQLLVGLSSAFAAGLRGEFATGEGDSYLGSGVFAREDDPWRTDRVRVSPLLVWRPSHGAAVKLQYDYDDSDHLGSTAHSVWLGFDVVLGAHAAHAH